MLLVKDPALYLSTSRNVRNERKGHGNSGRDERAPSSSRPVPLSGEQIRIGDLMPPSELWTSLVWTLAGAVLGRAFLPVAERLSRTTPCHRSQPAPAVVALVTAALFGLLAWRLGARAELLPYSCVALASVPLAAIDLAQFRLPTPLVWVSCLGTLVLFTLAATVEQGGHALLRGAGGMVALPAGYLAIALLSRGGLGAGDVRLATLVGLALGWQSWTTVVVGTVIALAYAGVAGLAGVTLGRLSRHSPIPFGPAMLAGALTAVLIRS